MIGMVGRGLSRRSALQAMLLAAAAVPLMSSKGGAEEPSALDQIITALAPPPSSEALAQIPDPGRRLLALRSYLRYGPKIAERWSGAIDAVPDAVPIISKVEKLPGFHLCTGFSGHGFGLGPGAGKLMAEIVTGETPCVDPSPFRYTRFFDGSNPRPTTGL